MIKREYYLKKIRPFINTDIVKIIRGVRRSGKSVMLELIQEELLNMGVKQEQIFKFNFESLALRELKDGYKLNDYIVDKAKNINGKAYIFFDEIQNVSNWELCINSLRVSIDSDIYITGSNSDLLSGELSTHLSGRYVSIVMYPFSFKEFIEVYKEADSKNLSNKEYFNKYLVYGGMPSLTKINYIEDGIKEFLKSTYDTIMINDIIKRKNVRDVDLLTRIYNYIMSVIGDQISANSINKHIKSEYRTCTTDTILNYLDYAVKAYLLYPVKQENLVGKQLMSLKHKYYLVDQGIREAVYENNMCDINLILENIVFMEALRRGYKVYFGKNKDREIDFVCHSNDKKVYIQVCYLLASEETIKREFGAYKGINDNYPKYVVSLDDYNFSQEGIKHVNIVQFLLEENW